MTKQRDLTIASNFNSSGKKLFVCLQNCSISQAVARSLLFIPQTACSKSTNITMRIFSTLDLLGFFSCIIMSARHAMIVMYAKAEYLTYAIRIIYVKKLFSLYIQCKGDIVVVDI